LVVQLFSASCFYFEIFILNADPPVILNGYTLCVRQPVSVALARGSKCSIEGFLGVTTIGLCGFMTGERAALSLGFVLASANRHSI
jgi:hypothetical protein